MAATRVVVATMVVALVAGAAGVFAYNQQGPAAAQPQPAQADLFYQQSLKDAGGAVHPMGELRGKVVLVNFWATWCVPCVKEIPSFSKVHADSGGKVAFVGLGIDNAESIASFNDRFKPSYPLLVAGAVGTELARAFGNPGGALPFTVLLGPDGRILQSHLGQVDEATLRQWIAPFLTGAKSAQRAGDSAPS